MNFLKSIGVVILAALALLLGVGLIALVVLLPTLVASAAVFAVLFLFGVSVAFWKVLLGTWAVLTVLGILKQTAK
jgi:hypothetical protein